jgi:hypothetical protein
VEYEDVHGKRERINFYEVDDVIYVFSAKDPGDCLLQKQQHYNDNKYTDTCKTKNFKFEKFILGKCVDEQILLKIYDLFLKNASIFPKDIVNKIINVLLDKFKSEEILLAALNHFIDSYKTKDESASVDLNNADQLMIRLNSNDDIKTVIEDYNKIYPDNPYNYNPASNTTDDVLKKELKDIVRPLVKNKKLAFGETEITISKTPIADIIIRNATFTLKLLKDTKGVGTHSQTSDVDKEKKLETLVNSFIQNQTLIVPGKLSSNKLNKILLICDKKNDPIDWFMFEINRLDILPDDKSRLIKSYINFWLDYYMIKNDLRGGKSTRFNRKDNRTNRLPQTLHRNKKRRHLKSSKFIKKRKNTLKKHVRF